LMTSRCPAGRVQAIYGGGGGGRDFVDAGAIFTGDLKGPKARLLLMVLLSGGAGGQQIVQTLAALAP
jgi:L-asparaginase